MIRVTILDSNGKIHSNMSVKDFNDFISRVEKIEGKQIVLKDSTKNPNVWIAKYKDVK